jgi:predicted enzyme related to lactoylglutathione lyase
MKINDSNVTIMVKNMDKAISFYENIGLKIKARWGDHYAMMTANGVTLGIHPANGKAKRSSGTVSIGFMIKDITEAEKLLKKNKIKCKGQNDGKSGIYLHFKDPDGTILYFVEPKW